MNATTAGFAHFDPPTGIAFCELESQSPALAACEQLEQQIWHQSGFGSLAEYADHNADSKVFGAFTQTDQCVGITRIFRGKNIAPPVLSMPFHDEDQLKSLLELARTGLLEELGTTAVDHNNCDAPRTTVSTNMWRLAYRDARKRGIKWWAVIMEPERIAMMNREFGFTFQQLGPPMEYQGGLCAAFLMDLEEVDEVMQARMPELHHWFVSEPLIQHFPAQRPGN